MTKISRLLTLAAVSGAVLTGTAFAQSASTSPMSSSDHMTSGHMTAMKQGAMSPHESGHMGSGAMMSYGHDRSSPGAKGEAPHANWTALIGTGGAAAAEERR